MRVGRVVSKGLVAALLLGPCVPQVDPRLFSVAPAPQLPFAATVKAEAKREAMLASVQRRPLLPRVARTEATLAAAYVAALSVSLEATPATFPSHTANLLGPHPAESLQYARDILRFLAAREARASLAAAPIQWPARGGLSSPFGRRWRQHHDGIDIAADEGAPIHAARDGRVVYAGWNGGYGLAVIIAHGNGLQTLYGHASAILVKPGQFVKAGQIVARVGSTGIATGAHLHFEFRINGRPVNPLRYL